MSARQDKLMIRTTMVLAAAVVGLTVQAKGQAEVDYVGKFATNPQFQAQFGDLDGLRKAALRRVHERIGLKPEQPELIVIKFMDARPADQDPVVVFRSPAFQTTRRGTTLEIRLHAEFLVTDPLVLGETLNHEMVHAVMRERMTPAAYRRLPRWFREGIALDVADQGPARCLSLLKSKPAVEDPSWLVPGLGENKFGLSRYPESWLAFSFCLERAKQRGLSNKDVRGAWKSLVDGTKLGTVLQRLTGLAMPELILEAKADGMRRLRKMRPASLTDIAGIWKLNRRGAWPRVITAAKRFCSRRRNTTGYGQALYLWGKALRMTKQHRAATSVLGRLQRQSRSDCTYVDDGLYQLGVVQLAIGASEDALSSFRRILDRYPDAQILDHAMWGIAKSQAELGQFEAAKATIARFRRSFQKGPAAKKINTLSSELQDE